MNGASSYARLRAYFLLFAVISALLMTSCAANNLRANGIFDIFKLPFKAELEFSCNGNASSFILTESEALQTISFTFPSELNGFSLCTQNGTTTIAYGSLEAEAPDSLAVIPSIISALIALTDDDLISIDTVNRDESKPNDSAVEAITQNATITFSGDGIPLGAEGTLCGTAFIIKFKSFQTADNDIADNRFLENYRIICDLSKKGGE